MFPLEDIDELLFQEPPILQQDSLVDHAVLKSSNRVAKSTKKRPRRSKSGHEENENEERKLRKTIHRDIERQRRQEMTSLYASLRSLLPLEYIRGKRSVSDHINEAMSYIKHMERTMKELQARRDKLKKIMLNENGSSKNSVNLPISCSVTVSSCRDGVEILISSGNKEENNGNNTPLSKVLMKLLQAGFAIVSCVSTKSNHKFLCRIQIQIVWDKGLVSDLLYINLPELQERLTNVINFG